MNAQRSFSPSATIVDSRWSAIALILSGMSLAFAVVLMMFLFEMRREIRFQSLRLDEYRVALMNAGIDPNPHVDGEMK